MGRRPADSADSGMLWTNLFDFLRASQPWGGGDGGDKHHRIHTSIGVDPPFLSFSPILVFVSTSATQEYINVLAAYPTHTNPPHVEYSSRVLRGQYRYKVNLHWLTPYKYCYTYPKRWDNANNILHPYCSKTCASKALGRPVGVNNIAGAGQGPGNCDVRAQVYAPPCQTINFIQALPSISQEMGLEKPYIPSVVFKNLCQPGSWPNEW
ncbi:hypothetical protein B0H19DRAFT_324957 [Mycena capillaripes]|nr:hypothetical protein B0H19DRAFT_324957 [Mycena capillaripes]